MNDLKITDVTRRLIDEGATELEADLNFIESHIHEALGREVSSPAALRDLRARTKDLRSTLDAGRRIGAAVEVSAEQAPILKTILLGLRRRLSAEVSRAKRNTQHPELIEMLDQRLAPLQAIAQESWFRDAVAVSVPRIGDFLTPSFLSAKRPPPSVEAREYDPKHAILLSTSQLWTDLPALRSDCASRRVPLSVVFADVDNFKDFNTLYGEPRVDREVLPVLMRSFDAAFFGHGRVYRYGGDEFVALVPNMTRSTFEPFIQGVRDRLAGSWYAGIDRSPTVSFGVCEVADDCTDTEDELLEHASSAKRFAKTRGKNSVAGCVATAGGRSNLELWLSGIRAPAVAES